MRAPLAIVVAKELLDSLRDRRTVFMVFFSSILVGPVLLVLLANYVASLEQKGAVPRVRMVGAEHAPALVNFLQRSDVEIEKPPADYERRIREGTLDAVIVVPGDFDERFLAGDGASVELVYDDSRSESSPAIRRAERLLRAFNRETGMLRMVARGVSPDLAEPVKVEHVNTATPQQKGAFLLFVIPVFAILSPLLGGMTVAIDSTAGERERGSLEPLLANPVAAEHFAVGKWLGAWAFASGVAALTLAGFAATAAFYADRRLAALMSFGPPEALGFLAMVIPLGAMTSALQLLVCTYCRSYREAQTFMGYLVTVVGFVPMLALFTGAREAGWQLLVPALGQQMVLSRILRGDALGPAEWLVPSAVAFSLAALCVAMVARLLGEERIVFGRA